MSKSSNTMHEILREYKTIWALMYSSSLLRWDLETNMPTEGASSRGMALAELALLTQTKTLALAPLVRRAEKEHLEDVDAGILRLLSRRIYYYDRVPAQLIEEVQKATTEARVVWRTAREKSDFKTFEPNLKRVLELKIKEGEKLANGGDPYDALLDQGEEGVTSRDLDSIFDSLVPSLRRIFTKVMARGDPPQKHPLEQHAYDTQAMKELNRSIVSILGMPMSRFRMDISAHPFTVGLDVDDVRITTRYGERDFRTSMYATIHESGHALYELQVGRDLRGTPAGHGVSSGFHESQSRFWENIVGRSREFVRLVTPALHGSLPFTSDYGPDELYRYANLVRPSLIRVDADEVTYNFHIALRYHVEKKLFRGEASVSEVPQIWAEELDRLLGTRPHSDSEGSLQDIHWSSGGFASFPNYTIGNVISGMCYASMSKTIDLAGAISDRNLAPIKGWLQEHIHRYGGVYPPRKLQEKVFRKVYDTGDLLNYLEKKYLS